MYGWMGKMLQVDLTAEACEEELLDPKVAKDYVGGRDLFQFRGHVSNYIQAGWI